MINYFTKMENMVNQCVDHVGNFVSEEDLVF